MCICKLIKRWRTIMTVADDIAAIKAGVVALQAAPAPVATVDLSGVATQSSVNAMAADVTAIKAELTITPVP